MAGQRDLPVLATNLTLVIPPECAAECGRRGFKYSGSQVPSSIHDCFAVVCMGKNWHLFEVFNLTEKSFKR